MINNNLHFIVYVTEKRVNSEETPVNSEETTQIKENESERKTAPCTLPQKQKVCYNICTLTQR